MDVSTCWEWRAWGVAAGRPTEDPAYISLPSRRRLQLCWRWKRLSLGTALEERTLDICISDTHECVIWLSYSYHSCLCRCLYLQCVTHTLIFIVYNNYTLLSTSVKRNIRCNHSLISYLFACDLWNDIPDGILPWTWARAAGRSKKIYLMYN